MTVTATDLHDRTSELTELAMKNPESPIIIEKRGKPAVVLLDAGHYEDLIETMELLGDPVAMEQIRQGIADLDAGRVVPHEQVMKEFGLDENTTRRDRVGRKSPARAQGDRKQNGRAKNGRKGK